MVTSVSMLTSPPVVCSIFSGATLDVPGPGLYSSGRLGDALGCPLAHEAEQVAGHPPHLDLLGAFGDAVPPVMAVDVLERLVAGGAPAAPGPPGAGGRRAAPAGAPAHWFS